MTESASPADAAFEAEVVDSFAELGITAGGSKSQLFKARAKLRTLLAHMIDGEANTRTQHPSSHVAPVY